MSELTWNQLADAEKQTANQLHSWIDTAFRGFEIPTSVALRINDQRVHPEVAEVRNILGLVGWEFANRELIIAELNGGTAIINLCDDQLFPYFVPLFMSLSLVESFVSDQDEMFVESLVHRLIGLGLNTHLDSSIYSEEQADLIRDFIHFAATVF